MAQRTEPLLSLEVIAEIYVTMLPVAKMFILFLLALYILWFWKVGMYDGFMQTFQALNNALKTVALWIYLGFMWILVSIGRIFRVIFATVRDFFISRI